MEKLSFRADPKVLALRVLGVLVSKFAKKHYEKYSKYEIEDLEQGCSIVYNDLENDWERYETLFDEYTTKFKDEETVLMDEAFVMDLWEFLSEKTFWKEVVEDVRLRRGVKVFKAHAEEGYLGDGVYDLYQDKFRTCESGGHFGAIIEFILEDYPDKEEYIVKGWKNLTKEEDQMMNDFILGRFKLIGSNQYNAWRQRRFVESTYSVKKGSYELKKERRKVNG